MSTVVVPSAATCSMRSSVCCSIVTEASECRKSPSSIVATWLLLSLDQAPSLCGCFFTNPFTEAGARRSELPWRRTGLTALPLTESYAARAFFSSSVWGLSG